jgi:CRP-like cAMP-binding protein
MEEQQLAILQQNLIISALPTALSERLLQMSALRHTAAQTLLFQQGEMSHDIFIIVEGSVTLSRRNRQDREFVLARLQPSDIFGEIEWLDRGPRLLAAKTHEPTTLLVLDSQQLQALEHSTDPLGVQLLHLLGVLLSQRLRSLDRQMLEAMLDPSILVQSSAPSAAAVTPDRDFFHEMMAGLFTNQRDRSTST